MASTIGTSCASPAGQTPAPRAQPAFLFPKQAWVKPTVVVEAPGPFKVFSPDTFTRREARLRFRRYKWLDYLRCCRAANRSATVAFAAAPAAAAIAAAMFGSSSAVFAPLNALA